MIKTARKMNQKAKMSVVRSIMAAAPPLVLLLNGIIA
jgi:hypothetical protein